MKLSISYTGSSLRVWLLYFSLISISFLFNMRQTYRAYLYTCRCFIEFVCLMSIVNASTVLCCNSQRGSTSLHDNRHRGFYTDFPQYQCSEALTPSPTQVLRPYATRPMLMKWRIYQSYSMEVAFAYNITSKTWQSAIESNPYGILAAVISMGHSRVSVASFLICWRREEIISTDSGG